MRAVIIGNGAMHDECFYRSVLRESDYIICADGGYDRALKLGITPNILVGDLDSVCHEPDIPVIKYPVKKDMTDGEIAVRYAVEHDFEEILMIGFTGNRLDHTISNLFFLKLICESGKKGMLLDERNEIYFLKDEITVCGSEGDIVSIVPIGCDVEGVCTEGLEYPLCNETLHFSSSRGISNVMLTKMCKITAKSGTALVIKSRD
ncbi:MAG: thiamine diphosphokinase [Clostridia bacterium]|nr:thiamine diphosphokinase [Clostridia bacterium]